MGILAGVLDEEMIVWLTLDSLWTYLIDGVPGCKMWVSEPIRTPDTNWRATEHDHAINAGKKILRRHDIAEIDNSIMWHYIPEMDMREPRHVRFDLMREHCLRSQEGHECTWKMPINVAPQEWFQIALMSAEPEVWIAVHAQKTFDLPF